MAAYAALVSLMQLIHQIENYPSPPISINKQQLISLKESISFLQEFLESYISPVAYSGRVDPLEIRIADAAYKVEDAIDFKIVDRIHAGSTFFGKLMRLSELFRGLCKCADFEDEDRYHRLHNAVHEMYSIKTEVMFIVPHKPSVQDLVHVRKKVPSTQHASSSTSRKESMMVGFDEVSHEVLVQLTRGQLNRQIIPIMGMGGIGKTTLARNLFENALTKEYFDVRVWTTISQVYNMIDTIREILSQAGGDSSGVGDNELGETLYKCLWGNRYLIVLDDIWSVEAWDEMKFFFPDNENGSRIIVTTRLSDLTSQLSVSYGVGINFLNEASSWDLFSKIVFGEDIVPIELKKIGENIVANCRGLPLSIATIGGLLAKSQRTIEHWKHIEENLNSIVIRNNDEYCLKVLRMSYVNLPNHLKPCFLYMGVFEEDWRIRVSTLKKLWVSEGFLKPIGGKSLEAVAEEYLKDLVDRNLILVHEFGLNGNVKFCKIHDLLRDLCLREAKNERFYYVLRPFGHDIDINDRRRVVIPKIISNVKVLEAFKYSLAARARSLICDDKKVQLYGNLTVLRTLKAYDKDRDVYAKFSLRDVFQLVNSRYISVRVDDDTTLPSTINALWSLQTLIIKSWHVLIIPVGIWEMHQLRHVEFISSVLNLPDPPRSHNNIIILENLQTLRGVMNLYLDENVVKRIPNIRKLDVSYEGKRMESLNCLSYLQYLSKLESFICWTRDEGCDEYFEKISFPHSLKKLQLKGLRVDLEDILQKTGLLPFLQKLVLDGGFFRTGKWETVEGQFSNLKLLSLSYCRDLKNWTISETCHFPLLRELRLKGIDEPEDIPSVLGDIATLKSIVLEHCGKSLVLSVKKIVEEQEDYYEDQLELYVTVICIWNSEVDALRYLTSPNFNVQRM